MATIEVPVPTNPDADPGDLAARPDLADLAMALRVAAAVIADAITELADALRQSADRSPGEKSLLGDDFQGCMSTLIPDGWPSAAVRPD